MAKLKAFIKTLEEAGDHQDMYAEVEGGFVLSVEAVDGFELANTKNLKTALTTERSAKEKALRDLKKFDGVDLDTLRSTAEAHAALLADPAADAKVKAAIAAREQSLITAHQREKSELTGKLEKTTGTLSEYVRRSAAVEAITGLKGSVRLLLPHVLSSTRVKVEDDGSVAVEVVDGKGNPRIGDSSGANMTVAQFVEELSKDETFGRAFEGTGAGGSGGGNDKNTNKNQSGGTGAVRKVSKSDAAAMAKYQDDIADGKAVVVD